MERTQASTESRAEERRANCPSCGKTLVFSERLLVGETFACSACQAPLEVDDPSSPALIRRTLVDGEEERALVERGD